MDKLSIVDADMHVRDSDAAIRALLPEPFNRRLQLYPAENFDRSFGGTLGKRQVDAQTQLRDMDAENIEVAVLYPTSGLKITDVIERDLAVALCRAYNDWIADYCRNSPERLKAVALLQIVDPEAAAAEFERAVTELGLVGAMVPAFSRFGPRNLGERALDPIYAMAERLDVPAAIHANGGVSPVNQERFGSFLELHVFSHVPEQMVAVTATVFGGVFERFPRLKVGFMEAGCGWLPFWLEHMDEEFELRHREVPHLSARPSEYLTSGRAYFGMEAEERLVPIACELVGEDVLLYASDYPHWDSSWPNSSQTLRERTDLTDRQKSKLLGENARGFYRLAAPVAAGTGAVER